MQTPAKKPEMFPRLKPQVKRTHIRRLSHTFAPQTFHVKILDENMLKEKLKPKKIDLLLRCLSVSKSPETRDFSPPVFESENLAGPELIGKKINFFHWTHSKIRAKKKVDSMVYANFS